MTAPKLLTPLAFALALGNALAAPTALNITATGKGYQAPASVRAGYVQVNLTNASKMQADVDFFRLKPGVTEAQFKAALTDIALERRKDADYRMINFVQSVPGGTVAMPGGRGSAIIRLTPGRYIMTSTSSDDTTHKTALSMGYYRPITVMGPALNNPPAKADYRINMVDYRFELPQEVTAGSHTWHITNGGHEAHFALVAKLLPGKTMDDAMKALMADKPAGPPPVDFSQSVYAQVEGPGGAEDVTWKLNKGDYVVVCFINAKNGVSHAKMGMVQGLSVK